MRLSLINVAILLRPKRRWFQFSLRTLFVLVTIFTLWLGFQVHRTRQQEKAIAAIEALGGCVYYNYQYPHDYLDTKAQPTIHKWLWPIFGRGRVQCVCFNLLPVNDEQLCDLPMLLNRLPQFLSLSFDRTKVGDATMERLIGLQNFVGLNIDGTNVTDKGLMHLKEMTNLQYLSIVFVDQLTDAGIELLVEFPQLRHVTFNTHNPEITQKSWDIANSIRDY